MKAEPERKDTIERIERVLKLTHKKSLTVTIPRLTAERAVSLLKEQESEAKWIYGEDKTGVDGWHCSECDFFEPWFYEFTDDIDFIRSYGHCPSCGRKMTSYTGKPTQSRGQSGMLTNDLFQVLYLNTDPETGISILELVSRDGTRRRVQAKLDPFNHIVNIITQVKFDRETGNWNIEEGQ